MKLISLYVAQFGALHDYSLEFEAGLTVVNKPNGYGKTTLAEFIRAMFYGFPRKSKALEKNLRQKYAPWEGGCFGGNLVFEHGNRRFRLERSFGATAKADSFCLIDLTANKKSTAYADPIGIALFGVDSDAFERSVYAPQQGTDGPLTTASIQAKLTALVEDDTDVSNFDKAVAALRAKRSSLVPYRGSSGAAAEAVEKITQLQLQLDQALPLQGQIAQLTEEIAQSQSACASTQKELAQIQEKQASAAQLAAHVLRVKHCTQLLQQRELTRQHCDALAQKYPAGFPDPDALSAAEAAADRLAALEMQQITTPADEQAFALLQETRSFPDRLPQPQQLRSCAEQIAALSDAAQKIRNTQQQISELSVTRNEQAVSLSKSQRNGLATVLWAAAGICLTAAVAFAACCRYPLAILCGLVGIIAFCGALAAQRTRRARDLETLQATAALDIRLTALQQNLAQLIQMQKQLRQQIHGFLEPYFDDLQPEQYRTCLTQLEQKTQFIRQARQQTADWQNRQQSQSSARAQCRRELADFFGRFCLDMPTNIRSGLRQIREDLQQKQLLDLRLQDLTAQLEPFQDVAQASASSHAEAAPDSEALKQRACALQDHLAQATRRLLAQKQQLQQLQELCAQIPRLRSELEYWTNKKLECLAQAKLLDHTLAYLQQARDRLSACYMDAIRTRFGDYLSVLTNDPSQRFFIDSELQVHLERHGKHRELASFSAGQTDAVLLCMRLALVDALFQDQQMFVILDDPFVNLDDAHIKQGLQLLQTLSGQRQILYFTCHSSRAPKNEN